ncbi:MAG TPA: hypothetical protein VIF15_09785 [Polyangiaceae bacterium]|jgi:hypothetical protein
MRTTLYGLTSLAVLSVATLLACGGGGADTGTTPKIAAPADSSFNPPPATAPESDKVTWKKDPAFAKCHNDVKTGADLVAGVTAMAQGCAKAMGMHQIGTTTQDMFKNLDPAHPIPLHAEAGHCYRVYGLSEDSLQDLDVAIVDSNNKVAAEDGSDSPDAVVLEDGEVCFTATDDVKVNVAAGNGAGKYAVQIWGN